MSGEVLKTLDSDLIQLSRKSLEVASPLTCERIRGALVAPWLTAYSDAGQKTLVMMSIDPSEATRSCDALMRNVLNSPIMFNDVAVWSLFFAALEASAHFQLDDCQNPHEEGHLSGLLLAGLRASCQKWCEIAVAPLRRIGSRLALQWIDLSILGGEQAVGGDFGLIFDLVSRNEHTQKLPRFGTNRIVPLVFQAKRYTRPNVNVSQSHRVRGSQYQLLAQNKCAAAYVLYENGQQKIELPLPPLVKPVQYVEGPTRTSVFCDSYDLSSYFLNAITNEGFAVGSSSADEALRMIFARARIDQLAYLAVISADNSAGERYSRALARLEPELRGNANDEHENA